ncbi:GNAT family N-acetyltransferase [Pseudomonas citronellolis]|uniref:GNAT family N-acetyltransferase n=1 Tax=Pseudomonas citronellolis TaxID=53408 RepID=UPI003AFFD988
MTSSHLKRCCGNHVGLFFYSAHSLNACYRGLEKHVPWYCRFATIFTKVQQQGEIGEIPLRYRFISHISVTPATRGAGTGKQLVTECERFAREWGCRWLRVPALAKNVQARGVYERLGFSEHLVPLEKSLA